MKREGVCCGLNVNTQFLEGIGRASWCRWFSRSAGRSRLLNLEKSVDASRRRGVVRIALSSPEWGGPKGENRKERDGTSECYRWLAKDDLMTKTGYGYAKCLTVAGTATSAPPRDVRPRTSRNNCPTKQIKTKKDGKKREEQKGVSSGKDCSVGNGGAKSMISLRRRLEGINEKRE